LPEALPGRAKIALALRDQAAKTITCFFSYDLFTRKFCDFKPAYQIITGQGQTIPALVQAIYNKARLACIASSTNTAASFERE